MPRNTRFLLQQREFDSRCFNEAEASLPRNTVNVYTNPQILLPASMRPRQACLGIRGGLGLPGRDLLASMRPRQACLGIRRLYFGLDLFAANASMRPRQACLGIRCDECLDVCPYNAASMRPRQACLGIPQILGLYIPLGTSLQ